MKSNVGGAVGTNNVLVSSAFLIPWNEKMITAHSTRNCILDMLENVRKATKKDEKKSMIIDISATTWNWDTYAIVAGTPCPIKLKFKNREELNQYLTFNKEGSNKEVVTESVLVPQPNKDNDDGVGMVWVPKGSILKGTFATTNSCPVNNNDNDKATSGMEEFIFEAPVDPNNDRLEHYEQCVTDGKMLHKNRAKLAHQCMRSMIRFYNLDRIVCWDLSWGIWEAMKEEGKEDDGFPKMSLLVHSSNDDNESPKSKPFPTSLDDDDDDTMSMFYDSCRPISPELLADSLKSVSGYYLVGGNTYTMSLFHHMWDQQLPEKGGHMQLMRDLLSKNEIFYSGHSAGAIMSGPNILTATFKGIDAFSVVTQPYNAPYLKLPPSESADTFFVTEKNNLEKSRQQMLKKMKQYDAWKGYNVAPKALTFPHYDARPKYASFPQSAETYLRATDDNGNFYQTTPSLFVGKVEPEDVTSLRQETNAAHLPCYPIANGHAVLLSYHDGGSNIVEALSPEEENAGILQWDCYMPYTKDPNYEQFVDDRTSYTKGSFTDDDSTITGDRVHTSPYNGARIFSRLKALGLPNPMDYDTHNVDTTTTNKESNDDHKAVNDKKIGLFRSTQVVD